ncbi:MAG: Na+/H+ antiporter NhaA [Caldilineaceae bacterium]
MSTVQNLATQSTAQPAGRSTLRRILDPFYEFTQQEASSGILLMVCTLLALLWANSPWGSSYVNLWESKVMLGSSSFGLSLSLLHWINDGLMAIFFFVVGLEIKREILIGELASLKKAALPIVAAIGGMVVPALLFSLFNANGEGASGWGVPMATDIAFAVGILALLGRHVPTSLKIFLTALAIVDDMGAVLVIALFYSHGLIWSYLLLAALLLLLLFVCNWANVHHPLPYLFLGAILWLALLGSGIHATIAGVLLAMTIPANRRIDTEQFTEQASAILHELKRAVADDENVNAVRQNAVQSLEEACEAAESLLQRLEHNLHPWVAFLIMPLFALANAGVRLENSITTVLSHPVSWGVIVGLVLGKQVGITLFSWLAVKMHWANLPGQVSWIQIYGAAWLAGIGFTMSLFIASLAFSDPLLLVMTKISILIASTLAGIGGWLLLRTRSDKMTDDRIH